MYIYVLIIIFKIMYVLIINVYILICIGEGRRKCSSVRGGVLFFMG